MIYLTCECGSGLGVPGSFLGEAVRCEDCGRVLRLAAGQVLENGRGLRWRLDVRTAPDPSRRGEHILLGGSFTVVVGSDAKAHLSLPGPAVSPAHCRLIPTKDGWFIEDAGSEHGVYINGERLRGTRLLVEGDVLDIGEYELHYGAVGRRELVAPIQPSRPVEMPPPASPPQSEPAAEQIPEIPPYVPPTGRPCPSCRKHLATNAFICVDCGIDVSTGRALLTARGIDEDQLHERARKTLAFLSWIPAPVSIVPIASEAPGHVKPLTIYVIALVTIFVSFVFHVAGSATPPGRLPPGAGLMLWSGDQAAAAELSKKGLEELEQDEREQAISPGEAQRIREMLQSPTLPYQPHQLLTHALLHGGLFHLAGNLVFMLVFGMRVNALVGNVKTAILYPLLAIVSGAGYLYAQRHAPATPMLGASGAIMGLAGMYVVLFPAYRVHVAVWLWRLLANFQLAYVILPIRGFWVVLFYIAFDVSATALRAEDGVAHWAHLGGFAAGVVLAVLLLLTRLVHARGGDIISVALGRRAWALVGRPRRSR